MTAEPLDELTTQFIAALQEHMAGGGEATLLRAYDLGRSAVAEQRNALEMLMVQQNALITILLQRVGAEESARLTQAAAEVFAESLAPFELARRSSQEGNALLHQVNEELERRVTARTAELVETNQALRREIIQRERAEVLLRENEERFRNAFDHAPIGMALLTPDGQWLEVNHALCAMLGRDERELLQTNVQSLIHPDDIADGRTNIQRLLTGEVASHQQEIRYLHKQGHIVWAVVSISLVRDAARNPLYLVVQIQDISERKRAEAWLQSLIDTTQDAVISIDRAGRIVQFNPAAERIFGYSKAEIVGQKVNVLMPHPYADEHDDYIAHYERTQEARMIGRMRTMAARRKTGEVFPIELSVTEIISDRDVRYGAFIRDISDRVRLQEQLIERERLAAIGTTAAKLVHEVGNPLNGMSVTTQLLARRLEKYREILDEKTFVSMDSLRHEINRLARLLQEFRLLSRRQQCSLRPTDIATVVRDIVTSEISHYTKRGVDVEYVLPDGLPLVDADTDRLKQVVLNLCKNAVEAMPHGGTLTVRAHRTRAHVMIEVADTGAGIPMGVNIFEPFVTTKTEGTGLGLPIAHEIITAHGGRLTYTSEPGQGTTFIVQLPLAPVDRGEEQENART